MSQKNLGKYKRFMPTNELNIFVHYQKKQMKIVTGASGMLGAHFLLELSKQNDQVVGIKRETSDVEWVKRLFKFEEPRFHKHLWDKIIWRNADLSDIFSLEDALFDATEVYHCAAMVNVVNARESIILDNNVIGTQHLIDVLVDLPQQIRLLHVSSISALGKPEAGNTITISTEWKSDKKQSPYSVSKHYSELEAWRGANEGLEVISVLPGVILGIAPKLAPSSTPFNYVQSGKKQTTLGLVGLVSVLDVVHHSLALMTIKEAIGKRFILVSDSWTFKKLMQEIAATLGIEPKLIVISKKKLHFLSKLESVSRLFTGKKKRLSASTIDAITNDFIYDGQEVVALTNINYSAISKEIGRVGRWMNLIN
jgi:dihydroflavonol-4-reductase